MSEAETANERKDFFISYTSADRQWAEWIAFELEAAGYQIIIQAWDFRPGSNFLAEMDQAARVAERTIAVLSPQYFASDYTFVEWAAAFRRDPKGEQRTLLPIRVQPCDVEGLLGAVVYIDLVGQDEQGARKRLLEGVQRERRKPSFVAFPGSATPATAQKTVQERPAFPGALPAIWNIPYPRNPFFTGRNEILEQLANALRTGQPTALSQPQTISGLGGIGKTQTAVEYAYRYHQDYQAVLWARADTIESLNASYSEIAALLNLPEQHAQEQELVVQAVKTWLRTRHGWLLILDNADEPERLLAFLPATVGGHLLVTTRASDLTELGLGFTHALEVQSFTPEQGALFLLHRAERLALDAPLEQANPQERMLAQQISQELGGLPLALDQAGAYLKTTRRDLASYLQLYRQHRLQLLKERRGREHPEPVATTWQISFERVEANNPAAAELLRFCGFLAPEAIPETILTKGANQLGLVLAPIAADAYLLDQAIEALRAYSLITRDAQTHLPSVHRLVQAVLRESVGAKEGKAWKQRAVQVVSAACPNVADVAQWDACEQWLPHALVCATWIEQEQIDMEEAAHLLNQAGYYLDDRARYEEAEPLYVRALAIREQQLGETHSYTALILNNLALVYQNQGRYGEAEPLLKRALTIREQQLGETHPDTAGSLNNLAALYNAQGKYEEAEPLYMRALMIKEWRLGETHPDTALSLNNLASLYQNQRRYGEAEPLLKRALAIYEQQLGEMHPDTVSSLNNLASLYNAQGKYEEAEPLLKRALAIREQQLGSMDPSMVSSLNNLAFLYQNQGKYEEAERLYVRAFTICEHILGSEHPKTQTVRENYVILLLEMGRDGESSA